MAEKTYTTNPLKGKETLKRLKTTLRNAPVIGTVADVIDIGKDVVTGDYAGAAVATGTALAGITPIGRIASKGAKVIGKKLKKLSKVDESKDSLKAINLTEKDLENWKKDPNNITSTEFKKKLEGREEELQNIAKSYKDNPTDETLDLYRRKVTELNPIKKIETMPDKPSFLDVRGALGIKVDSLAGKKTGIIGLNRNIEDGQRIASRLDINGYTNHNKWVATLTIPKNLIRDWVSKNPTLSPTSYATAVRLKNVDLKQTESLQKKSLDIAAGRAKGPHAVMEGDYSADDPDDIYKYAREIFESKDKDWIQVGYNPTRAGFFYDRGTGLPIESADEILQVGPLVLAKNAIGGSIRDYMYNKGGLTTDEQTQQAFNQGGYGVAGKFTPDTGVSAAKEKGNFKGLGYKGEAKKGPVETKPYGGFQESVDMSSKGDDDKSASASVTPDRIKKNQLAQTKFTPANFQSSLSGQFDQYKKVDPETYSGLKFKADTVMPDDTTSEFTKAYRYQRLGYLGEPVYPKFENLSKRGQDFVKKYGMKSMTSQTLRERQEEVQLEELLKKIEGSKALEKLNFETNFDKKIENLPDVLRAIIATKKYYTAQITDNFTATADTIFERPTFSVDWISNLSDSKDNGRITPEGFLIAKFFAQAVKPLKYNPEAIDPALDEFNWCSAFIDHILSLTGNPRIKADVDPVTGTVTNTGAAANSYKKYGTQVKGGLDNANSGDIVVFNFDEESDADHTSFLIGEEDYELFGIKPQANMVYVLGGNQSNQVQVSSYPKSTILDIRRINRITKKEVKQLKKDNPQYKGYVEFSKAPMDRPTSLSKNVMPKNYQVKANDTLDKVAKQFNTTVDKILELNPDLRKNPNLINVGQNIRISNSKGGLTTHNQTQQAFYQGGLTMEQQMNLFKEGGMKDDGLDRDPVSGNEIPPGSLAKEVRDDIPAQLSEGEYVVPADVVQYYGVKFFEDLRMQAKRGLAQMAATGRIGGEPVSVTMIAIGEEEKKKKKKYLGGPVGFTNGGVSSDVTQVEAGRTFNPDDFKTVGGSLRPNRSNPANQQGVTRTATYYNQTTGEAHQVTFVNNTITPPEDVQYTKPPQYSLIPPSPTNIQAQRSRSDDNEDRRGDSSPPGWGADPDKYDFTGWDQDRFEQEIDSLVNPTGIAGAIFGRVPLIRTGGLANAITAMKLAESKGIDTAGMQEQIDEAIKGMPSWEVSIAKGLTQDSIIVPFLENLGNTNPSVNNINTGGGGGNGGITPTAPTGDDDDDNESLGIAKDSAKSIMNTDGSVTERVFEEQDDPQEAALSTAYGGGEAAKKFGANKGGLLQRSKSKLKTRKPRGKGLGIKK